MPKSIEAAEGLSPLQIGAAFVILIGIVFAFSLLETQQFRKRHGLDE